jgi:hypothetical protein
MGLRQSFGPMMSALVSFVIFVGECEKNRRHSKPSFVGLVTQWMLVHRTFNFYVSLFLLAHHLSLIYVFLLHLLILSLIRFPSTFRSNAMSPVCQTCHQLSFVHRCPYDKNAPLVWRPGDLTRCLNESPQSLPEWIHLDEVGRLSPSKDGNKEIHNIPSLGLLYLNTPH